METEAKKRIKKNIFASLIISISLGVVLGVYISPAKAISITSGPTAINVGATEATINWQTDENGDSQVYYTSSGGEVWTSQDSGFTNAIWYSVAGVDDNVWAAGRDGRITYTDNGGDNWQPQSTPTNSHLYGIYATDTNNVWAVGASGTVIYNNGTNWTTQDPATSTLFNDVSGFDANHVWAVGNGGTIRFYNGAGWSPQNSGTINALQEIYALDATHVWAVGASGTILFYNGSNWTTQNSGVADSLYSVSAADSSHVWAVGAGGTLLFYNGSNWTAQASGTTQYLLDVSVIDSTNVWACGTSSTVISTNNGVNWVPRNHPGGRTGVYALRNNLLWFVGTNNLIERYGINYDNFKYDATQVTSHSMLLDGLAPLTTYHYYVCSKNLAGEEVCSNDYTFTTITACADGTPDGQCNAADQYCDVTTLVPAAGPNCVRCGFDCSANPATPFCDPGSESCIASCPDGTLPGACSAGRYCDPATLQLSNSCVENSANCGFSCPAATPYCNPGNGNCEAACPDGTSFNTCNAANQYCDNGTLTPVSGNPNCVRCGYVCPAATPYCDPVSEECIASCPDGTSAGNCNGDQYCDPADLTLKQLCTQCSYTCPAANPFCNVASGACEANCPDGTTAGNCNATQEYCDPGTFTLRTDCATKIANCGFSCPVEAPFCNGTNCIASCPDGTAAGMCSATNQWCDPATLTLVSDCTRCSYTCPASDPFCNAVSGSCEGDKCADGTPLDTCRADLQYCDPVTKTIGYNCTKCGYACAEPTPYCNVANGNCESKCPPSGTDPNACDGNQWCNPTTYLLEDNCTHCGYTCAMPNPYCNMGTGNCEDKCLDGTAADSCSGDQYCDPASLTLISDCRQCSYTCPAATPQCNMTTGLCEADNIPPTIFNINVIPDLFSAVITFETSESTWAIVSLDTTPVCNGGVDIMGLGFTDSHSFPFGWPAVVLTPSTTYYFCIWAYDAAANEATRLQVDPELTFTTLAEPDLIDPTVSIDVPTEAQVISNSQTFEVTANDDESGVASVNLYIDGDFSAPLVSWIAEPYEFVFDSTLYANGAHTLVAEAFDGAGNTAQTPVRNFTINNDASPPIISNVDTSVDVAATGHYAIITWDTDEPATSRVDYVLENMDNTYDTTYGGDVACADPGICAQDGAYVMNHVIQLDALEANRRYHFRLTSCDNDNNCTH